MAARAMPGSPGAILLSLVALVAAVVFAIFAVRGLAEIGPETTFALVMVAVLGVAAVIAARSTPRASRGDVPFLIVVLLAFVVTRLPWAIASPSTPISDFLLYDVLARQIAAGGPVVMEWPSMGVIAAWGYAIALALPYALIAPDPLVARLFNLLLGALTIVALHGFTRRAAGVGAARAACMLFLLWPGELLYVGVLASEHLAMPLLLLGFWCVAESFDRRQDDLAAGVLAGAGVLLAGTYLTRSVLGVSLVAVLVVLLLDDARRPVQRLARSIVVVVSFASTVTLSLALLEATVAARPVSGGWWSLYVGANAERGGAWSFEDAASFGAHPDIASANRFARDETLRRVSADPSGYASLAVAKMANVWGDGAHALYWSEVSMREGPTAGRFVEAKEELKAIAQAFHVVVLTLAALGLAVLGVRRAPASGASVAVVMLLFGTAAHGVVEAQARYNFALVPMLLVLAASGVAWLVRARSSVPHAVAAVVVGAERRRA